MNENQVPDADNDADRGSTLDISVSRPRCAECAEIERLTQELDLCAEALVTASIEAVRLWSQQDTLLAAAKQVLGNLASVKRKTQADYAAYTTLGIAIAFCEEKP